MGDWTHAFFTVVRTGCFVAEVVKRPRYEFLTVNARCKAMVVCHARCSILSSGKLLMGWGEPDKRLRLEALFKREKSMAAKQAGMPKICESLVQRLSALTVGGREVEYLSLKKFGEKWGQGKQLTEHSGDVMQLAKLSMNWGVSDLHSTACDLSGLSVPFGATTTKFVPAMLSREATRMQVATTEESPLSAEGTEITVQGGHHLSMRNGYYAATEGKQVIVLDFASMHPTIAIAGNICPTGRGVLPAALSRLLEIKLKCELGGTTADRVKRAYVKFQMVATTGWLGRKLVNGGTTKRRECYARILATTRDILESVIDHCKCLSITEEFKGIDVVYGVTDSVFLSVPRRQSIDVGALLSNINTSLILPRYGAPIRLTHERTFVTLLLLKRNQYCGCTDESGFYHVGIRRRTDHEIASTLDDLIFRTLVAPSPARATVALGELTVQLEPRNHWRSHARSVVQAVERACDGGPSPPIITKVLQMIDQVTPPTGRVKRSLDRY